MKTNKAKTTTPKAKTKASAKAKTSVKAKASTKAEAARKKRDLDKGGWYMDENGKIPLEEYFKDYPKPTGPKRSEVMKKLGLFPYIEIVDMRAVMK
ncbi:MAG: hypothetical protein LBU42_01615 [Prevotellaceae bacterium]|jgi:hypothetical protein|nr:hypothetical protein [Prevotellaceae bacterium]